MPARLRDLMRALAAMGGSIEPPSSGSHWRARLAGRLYPLPAHNGLKAEIDDRYIRLMCRALGIDEAELRRRL